MTTGFSLHPNPDIPRQNGPGYKGKGPMTLKVRSWGDLMRGDTHQTFYGDGFFHATHIRYHRLWAGISIDCGGESWRVPKLQVNFEVPHSIIRIGWLKTAVGLHFGMDDLWPYQPD